MSARQFLLWMAYYDLEPFGEWRADVRAAQVSSYIFNTTRAKPEDTRTVEHFILDWEAAAAKRAEQETKPPAPPRQQTIDEQVAIAKMWVEAYNNSVEG